VEDWQICLKEIKNSVLEQWDKEQLHQIVMMMMMMMMMMLIMGGGGDVPEQRGSDGTNSNISTCYDALGL